MVWILLSALGFFLVLVVGAAMFIGGIYNRLVTLKNRFQNAFSQIEVQLKRRYDLIPNLVATAKGYMTHERETLEAVIAARNTAMNSLQKASQDPGSEAAMRALGSSEAGLGGVMARFSMLTENYPDLKANQNMLQLSEELTSTENKVAFSRQAYNDAVTEYNTYKQTFPPVFIAGMVGHGKDAVLLEFDSAAIAEAPKVAF